ncbi:hypothetical protein GIW70_09005 [Pseudomonas syringae]|nr:hypothetical protein [Pseudomonas syringae]MCF5068333.1 hypothetical protein [Pseudomonas syringae]
MTMHDAQLISRTELATPVIEGVEGSVIDPAMGRVVVRVAPYSGMACGDKVVLIWAGLDAEGLGYRHEMSRFVSDGQVAKDIVFVVKNVHLAALDGGSLELRWALTCAARPEPEISTALVLDVGDVNDHLLPAVIDDAVGGTLDPDRVPLGASVTLRPYARMKAGDRICWSWEGVSSAVPFEDSLTVEGFAVGETLGVWVAPEYIRAHISGEVSVTYRVEQAGETPRSSEPAKILIAPLQRGTLRAPDVLELQNGVLKLEDALDGVTVVIDNARAEAGELVYLQCNGTLFSHHDEREITGENAGDALVFIVPYRFWREHQGTEVRIFFQVERLDDTSQVSDAVIVQVEAQVSVESSACNAQPSGL